MEKVIVTLQRAEADDAWCAALRTDVADSLLGLGLAGVTVNVRDAPVRDRRRRPEFAAASRRSGTGLRRYGHRGLAQMRRQHALQPVHENAGTPRQAPALSPLLTVTAPRIGLSR